MTTPESTTESSPSSIDRYRECDPPVIGVTAATRGVEPSYPVPVASTTWSGRKYALCTVTGFLSLSSTKVSGASSLKVLVDQVWVSSSATKPSSNLPPMYSGYSSLPNT